MAFRVSTEVHGDRKVYRLHDDSAGSSAAVLPSFGFNLFDLRLPVAGQARPILAAEPDWADRPRDAGRNGTPVLFPYPNRVRGGKFRFQDRDYALPINNGPNAIHGFAISAAWDVVEHQATDDGAAITGRFQISKHAPEMLEHWPADAILQIRYVLAGRKLALTATVTNPSAQDLPYGFGIHPYFRLPLAEGGDPAQTRVIVPASEFWVLDAFLPTGARQSVDSRLDFRKGQPIKGLKLDDVLTDLTFTGDRCICRLVDEALRAEFRLSFDHPFREVVMYTPPGTGTVIALEPYTQTTDAINLQPRGTDAGLRVLGHGREDALSIGFETVG